MILGLDQGINLTGWCVGDGSAVPTAGAWRFDTIEAEDIGLLCHTYRTNLVQLVDRYGVTHVVFEAPLVDRYRDTVLTLRRRMGIDGVLEGYCYGRGIVCEEEPFGPIKRELGGFAGAKKADMVYAARKLGVQLPATQAAGMEDAADSAGAWLIGVRHYCKAHAARWDQVLYSRRR